MRKNITFIAISTLLLFSCNPYENAPVSENYIQTLNEQITVQQSKGASWTNSPDDIARELFPPVLHEGSRQYGISKSESQGGYRVSVTEEGPINDQIEGERRTLYFEESDGVWKITSLEYEVKRR